MSELSNGAYGGYSAVGREGAALLELQPPCASLAQTLERVTPSLECLRKRREMIANVVEGWNPNRRATPNALFEQDSPRRCAVCTERVPPETADAGRPA